MDDIKILDKFRQWIREQPVYVVSEDPETKLEQIDDAPFDYIEDFCRENKYKDKTFEQLLEWIELRNEVFVFLEENGIK